MPSLCSLEGCNRPLDSFGFCGMHAMRFKRHGDPGPVERIIPVQTFRQRFWSGVNKKGPIPANRALGRCWIWTRNRFSNGYGQTSLNKAKLLTHRVAYELKIGPIQDGLQLDHLCRNRICVNPKHLEAVTCRENNLRSLRDRGKLRVS